MKMKNWKHRTIILLLCILAVSGILYWAMGCPVFTAEQSFRRDEASYALGPGNILGTESIDCPGYGYDYDTMIVAETERGCILYCCNLNEAERLYYREKQGSMTIMALPNGSWSWLKDEPRQLNVVLFDDYPEAVRADVKIQLDWSKNFYGFTPEGVHYTYDLTAKREEDGYFHFVHTIYGSDYIDNNNAAFKMLTDICCDTGVDEVYYWQLEIPATVRLYDQDNNLIIEQTLVLRSIGAEERDKICK